MAIVVVDGGRDEGRGALCEDEEEEGVEEVEEAEEEEKDEEELQLEMREVILINLQTHGGGEEDRRRR